MSSTNDFQIFAGQSGANVITQAQYLALAALGPGFTAGIAQSAQLNKVWRQSSTMASLLGQLMADITTQNVSDAGVLSALLPQLAMTLTSISGGPDTGSGNSYVVNIPGIGTTNFALLDQMRISFHATHANTAGATLSVNGAAASNLVNSIGGALVANDIPAGALIECIWHAAVGVWVIIGLANGPSYAVTATAGDNTNKVATTAFVKTAVTAAGPVVFADVSSTGTVNHQGGTNTVSVNHTGTGVYVVSFGTALSDANYAAVATSYQPSTVYPTITAHSATSFTVTFTNTTSDAVSDSEFAVIVYH